MKTERLTKSQVRELLKGYFGTMDFKFEYKCIKGNVFLDVMYGSFLPEEDVAADISRLVSEDVIVDVRCCMGRLEYMAQMLLQIEEERRQMVETLKEKPHFCEWHVNRYVLFPLVELQEILSRHLRNVRELEKNPQSIEVWDLKTCMSVV